MKDPFSHKTKSGAEGTSEITSCDFSVHTFGYGSSHNLHLLKDVSVEGNRLYFFIHTKKDISKSFSNFLGGLLSTVGHNINLKVELMNGVSSTC